jgi:hypothetical protein
MDMNDQLHAQAGFALGNEFQVPIGYEVELASKPVWTLWRNENSLSLAENRTPITRPTSP